MAPHLCLSLIFISSCPFFIVLRRRARHEGKVGESTVHERPPIRGLPCCDGDLRSASSSTKFCQKVGLLCVYQHNTLALLCKPCLDRLPAGDHGHLLLDGGEHSAQASDLHGHSSLRLCDVDRAEGIREVETVEV